MKKILIIAGKIVAGIILFAAIIIVLSEFSPVYKFDSPKPFEGPDVFNPYAGVKPGTDWKRSNFHTHTRVKGLINECRYQPSEALDSLQTYGYSIVTFSNHNKLTLHPDSTLQANVYEHGLNLFKYHKLVFGSDRVLHFDNILPFFAFQRQFQLDLLSKKSDFIQLNHPFRTNFTGRLTMEQLSGYQITELDSGVTTDQEYWDWSLSAGRYSFGLANDDLHHLDRSDRIAVRCNFLDCPSGRYEDIRECLLSGRYYSMRVPDYGSGNWSVKHAKNNELPSINSIGVEGSEIFMTLSDVADSIRVTGSGGKTLALASGTDSIRYSLPSDEPYARLTAFFPDGAVIYTNPFARYSHSFSDSPFREFPHPVSWVLTILWNLALALLAWALTRLLVKLTKLDQRPRRFI